jgi:hypothetical protein
VKANKEFCYGTPLKRLQKLPAVGLSESAACVAGPLRLEEEVRLSDLSFRAATKVIWLILPVVICLSQRLSHACLSINFYTVKLRMAH